jgi:hypothetical protein
MAHAAHHGHGAAHDGARQGLVIERPQVLDRSAATHQQDDVDRPLPGQLVERLERPDQVGDGLAALDRRRGQHHRQVGDPPPQRRRHVVQRGGAERRDQADAAWQSRQVPLALLVEQAFGLELGFQAQEPLVPGALPRPLQALDDELEIAPGFVDGDPALHFDQVAVGGNEVQQRCRTPEHRAAQLALRILEGEVEVPAGGPREARNLAADRDRIEPGVQEVSNGAAQRADLPDARRCCWLGSLDHHQWRGCGPVPTAGFIHNTANPCSDSMPNRAKRDSAEQAVDFKGYFSAENVIELTRRSVDAASRHGGWGLCTKLSTKIVGRVLRAIAFFLQRARPP